MNIIFFGDSIFYGQFVDKNEIWIEKIRKEILKINSNIKIFNSSVCGDTTRLALLRISEDVQKFEPDIIFIQFGINDSNYWQTDNGYPRVSENSFRANIKEIIERCECFGVKKVFLLTNNPTLKILNINNREIQQNIGVKKYNTIIREIIQEQDNIILIDVEEVFYNEIKEGKELKTFLLEDKVHLNLQGHYLYYKCVYPFLEEAINC